VLGLVLFTLPVSNALAGRCGDDIRRIDEALKNQYGGSGAWWEWLLARMRLSVLFAAPRN
jgi:hypothetical protein